MHSLIPHFNFCPCCLVWSSRPSGRAPQPSFSHLLSVAEVFSAGQAGMREPEQLQPVFQEAACAVAYREAAGYLPQLLGPPGASYDLTSCLSQSWASPASARQCPGPWMDKDSRSFCFSFLIQVSIPWGLCSPSRHL